MSNPKVSVIVPVYNKEPYLRGCVDSLRSQTLEDIEIIMIDDGSLDRSYEVIQELAARDERLIVQKNPYNIGAGRTRNIGLNLARGKYVAVLDADDAYDRFFLQDMFEEGERTEADVILCGYILDYNNGVQERMGSFLDRYYDKVSKPFPPEKFSDCIFSLWSVAPWSKMCRREYIVNQDVWFQDLENSNDVYWGAMVLAKAEKISFLPKQYVLHRRGITGQITEYRGKNPYCANEALKKILRELVKHNKYKALKKAFEEQAVNSIGYQYICANDKVRQGYKKYIQSVGLDELKMQWNDFKYMKRDVLLSVSNEKRIQEQYRYYDRVLAELYEGGYKAALWGYGELGKELLHKCGELKVICEIYDIDCRKHGYAENGLKVTGLEQGLNEIDVIVITNSRFTPQIVEAIKACKKEYLKIIELPVMAKLKLNIQEGLLDIC